MMPGLQEFGSGIYLASSSYCKWENRAAIMNRKFFLERLIPFAESNPAGREVNGWSDLELRINK